MTISQLHADAVCVLFGVTVALVIVACTTVIPRIVRRFSSVVLVTEFAQGAVGFTQYFARLPWGLVLAHITLAALLTAVITVLFDLSHSTPFGATT